MNQNGYLRRQLLTVILAGFAGFHPATGVSLRAEAPLPATKRPDPARFEKELAKFDAEFKENPVTGGIVFTGSSSIRLWKTAEAFPKLPVLNRGFGGSVANDLVVHAERVALRYQPKVMVVYTGSNDLNAKLSAEEVLADYTTFLNRVHEKLPNCRIIVNPVKVSESRIKQIPSVNKLNGMLQAWCEGKDWVRWLETMSYLVDENGKPRNEFYRKDKLHLNDAGYAKWNAILEPVLQEEWAKAQGQGS